MNPKIIEANTRLVDVTIEEIIPFLEEIIIKTITPLVVNHDSNPETIQIEKLCQMFGWSKSAIYKKCSLRKIPHYKVDGGELRFNVEEINHWINEQKCKTGDELVSEFEHKNKIKGK